MPEIKISKIKIRRGTNSQRKTLILDQGEIVGTTDGNRLYVGNGVLSGGVSIASQIHPPISKASSLSTVIAETGDLVLANNLYYQLTGNDYTSLSDWGNVSQKFTSQYFEYDNNNTLYISSSALSADMLDRNTVGNGLKVLDYTIQADYNTKSIEISAGQLSLKNSGIDEREISSTTFINGISGGSGDKIGINFNNSQFYLSSGVLNLSTGNIIDVDNDSIVETNGIISINNGVTPSTKELPRVTIDQYGRVLGQTSSILDTLSGSSTLNSSNTLSSIFNGTPSHTLSGGIPGLEITKFEAISSNGTTTSVLTLSSAGFIIFDGNYDTRSGSTVGRFAVPIFAY